MALQTVAQKTKIAVHCLKAMEDSDHDRLPPAAYVKGFIRSYARIVGANGDIAVDLYLSDLERRKTVTRQKLKRRATLEIVQRALMATGAIFTILLAVHTATVFLDPEPTPDTPMPETAVMPTSPSIATATDPGRLLATDTPEKLKLQVLAVERTWLKVIVDGQQVRSYELKPADRLELEGAHHFNLMIGSATGLKIVLNDRPVKIYGSHGQVVSLKIP